MKKVLTYMMIVVVAFVAALNYQLFIFPNSFAPSGINGICTMIQHVFGISVGYLSLLINIPLAIAVYFLVSKPLAIRSALYVVVFSVALVVLDGVDLSRFAYSTENGTSTILGPLVSGIIVGTIYALLARGGAYTGGMDFVASLIHRWNPEKNLFFVIFALNCCVAIISYFVYGFQMEPVILCILHSFASSTISDRTGKSIRAAVRFEIVTDHPEEISEAIIHQLHHSATLLPGKGIYKGKETSVLVCVINKTQASQLSAIVRSYPDTFTIMSQVNEVVGNFKRLDKHGKAEKQLLDAGNVEF